MNIKTLLQASILFVLISVICGCNPLAIKGPEPAFLDIPSIEFIHSLEQGSRRHKIEHVEIFFENFSIGYYELPINIALIPTLETSSISIFPAIRLNGQLNKITSYGMMQPHEENISFVQGETYTIIPKFTYKDNIVFDYVESFESTNSLNFDLDEIDSTQSIRVNDMQADGLFSCLISENNGATIEVATEFLFTDLINDGRSVFVEFEYKNDKNFTFGVAAFGNNMSLNIPFITLVSKDEWNKIYLDITPIFIQAPAQGYKLYFQLESLNIESPTDVYIDNLKLIHIP